LRTFVVRSAIDGARKRFRIMQAVCEMNPSHLACGSREHSSLTGREREIVELVSAGYTNRELARKLEISENAVHYHLAGVFDKLGVSNRIELVLFVAHQGSREVA